MLTTVMLFVISVSCFQALTLVSEILLTSLSNNFVVSLIFFECVSLPFTDVFVSGGEFGSGVQHLQRLKRQDKFEQYQVFNTNY